ncbi:transcriptional regulator, LysR family [Aliiroseovarius halocynthiae]|uniref:Transcriptional regulator GcvA n=1 Tax=Aliiroseovarius halocynthiae TaxID=985055 RepID=A0A545SZP2_9RHOB|nr:transcriptional regulator GcvA [Aliiroseovarius halocynthiae]TQV70444.1 transcriptional regulator GcvA [Aliiroseovarius halocynthiae]SMR81837.1 transcriptional regulator, LysR family [Aliiroseovarius halocynthiae]
MSDRLPPLTALRAFDAAARHMSFQKAAAELNVTPAALSFQIKSLEEHFGAPLFLRLNRAVELTEAGRLLAPGAADGFEMLAGAWRNARRSLNSNTLTVTAGPAFTSKWLAPRLYAFAQDHPEIELRFAAGLKFVDLNRDEVDVAIRFGYGPDDGLYSMPLADEWLTPVMLPSLAEKYPTPAELIDAPLIHNTSDDFLKPRCDWSAWFRVARVDGAPRIASVFSQPDHALDAAMSGVGVVLGRRAFVVKYLAEGRLVAPYKLALTTKARFRFLCRLGQENRPAIVAFRDWVLAEIKKTAQVSAGLEFATPEDSP